MKRNLKSYENQAKYSVVLAGVAALCTAFAVFCVLYKFDWTSFTLTYNRNGKRLLIIAAALFVSLAASIVGFCVGFNSAGQHRNKKSRLSWTGFFLNAALMAIAFMTAVFFIITRDPIRIE